MKIKIYIISIVVFCISQLIRSQNIADFVSVTPAVQTDQFIFPTSHRFQKIIEVGDALTQGGLFPVRPDFTGYVPINGSSTIGYLSVNSEARPGGVTILDLSFNLTTKFWEISDSEVLDFTSVGGTNSNCSGAVTPWNTIISSEEYILTSDDNNDGYYDSGWNVEIDPATKTVLGKLWALGNFEHENVAIHSNHRTVYQGADSNPGYLYKFVADTAQDLSSGALYVYVGDKNGSGNWVQLQNSTPEERNSTLVQSFAVSATSFNGIEDVEIGPDGKVYFAVKGENQVYRFQDSDPISGTTAEMETFVGNMAYEIAHNSGTTNATWGYGNDNLAFDNIGNLWVLQDGVHDYIWVVGSNHTQSNPVVRLFGIAPAGSEPTGITFSPDFKYLFMSIQHPNTTNLANQIDVLGNTINFNKGTVLVIALPENLGTVLDIENYDDKKPFKLFPNPIASSSTLVLKGDHIQTVKLFTITGRLIKTIETDSELEFQFTIPNLVPGVYVIQVNNIQSIKIVIVD